MRSLEHADADSDNLWHEDCQETKLGLISVATWAYIGAMRT